MILTILTVFFVSFTGSTQTDSTLCFTKEEVKVFLRTKVELNQCLESNEILINELNDLTAENINLEEEKIVLQERAEELRTQRNRTRWIAFGSGVVGILSTLLHFIK